MNRKQCFGRRDDSSHLLVCPSCRTDARIAAAWRDLRVDEPIEPAEERFVDSALRSVRRDRAARRRRRLIAAAAAAALFSFFAGLAHETARTTTPDSEESYASLSAPNALTELLPN
jgi:hypothetical protein